MPVSHLILCAPAPLGLAYRRCFPWYANELNYLFYHKWFCLSNLEIASSSVNQPQASIPYLFSATNSICNCSSSSSSISNSNFQPQLEFYLSHSLSVSFALSPVMPSHSIACPGLASHLLCVLCCTLLSFSYNWASGPSDVVVDVASPSPSCRRGRHYSRSQRRLDSFASGRIFWRYLCVEISHSSCQISCVFIYHRRGSSLSLLSL